MQRPLFFGRKTLALCIVLVTSKQRPLSEGRTQVQSGGSTMTQWAPNHRTVVVDNRCTDPFAHCSLFYCLVKGDSEYGIRTLPRITAVSTLFLVNRKSETSTRVLHTSIDVTFPLVPR